MQQSSAVPCQAHSREDTKNSGVCLAAFRSKLEDRWKKYRKRVSRNWNVSSPASIHDLRVATRRLIATLDFLGQFEPALRVKKARRSLKDRLFRLRELRDVHVELINVEEMLSSFPQIAEFRRYLRQQERRLTNAVESEWFGFSSPNLKGKVRAVRKRLDALLKDRPNGNEYGAQIASVLSETFSELIDSRNRIDPANPSTIHRVRVRFKKFRYMVEMLPWISDDEIDRLRRYQDMMGDIQDIVVLRESLNAFCATRGGSWPERFPPILQHLDDNQAELIRKYLLSADDLYTFSHLIKLSSINPKVVAPSGETTVARGREWLG